MGHACSFTHTHMSLQTGATEGMERESAIIIFCMYDSIGRPCGDPLDNACTYVPTCTYIFTYMYVRMYMYDTGILVCTIPLSLSPSLPSLPPSPPSLPLLATPPCCPLGRIHSQPIWTNNTSYKGERERVRERERGRERERERGREREREINKPLASFLPRHETQTSCTAKREKYCRNDNKIIVLYM